MTELTAPFPATDRVVYGRNPLHEVICQVRFPPLLRLQAQPPFEFQEAIQSHFPIYGQPEHQLDLPIQIAEIVPNISRIPSHRFLSEDEDRTVTLQQDFLALTCSKYSSWQDFSELLFDTLKAFCDVYKPSFFTRIGLRYQNMIRKDWIDESVDWTDLINQSLVGPLADKELEDRLFNARSSLMLNLGNHGDKVHFQYGLAELDNCKCFILDFDYFFDTKVEITEAENVINRLYGYSGPAFHWAITKRLHEAMEPR